MTIATRHPASPEIVRGSCVANAASKSEKKARLASERRMNAAMQLGPATEQIVLMYACVPPMGRNYSAAWGIRSKLQVTRHRTVRGISVGNAWFAPGGTMEFHCFPIIFLLSSLIAAAMDVVMATLTKGEQ